MQVENFPNQASAIFGSCPQRVINALKTNDRHYSSDLRGKAAKRLDRMKRKAIKTPHSVLTAAGRFCGGHQIHAALDVYLDLFKKANN